MKIFSKKILIMMSLVLTSTAFTACSGDDDDDFGGGTASTSTTRLWPAYNANEELWGYINENGEWAIKPQFTSAGKFSCGLAEVFVANSKSYYIDTNGNYMIGNAKFDEGKTFSNNYAVVFSDNGMICSLIDRNCNYVIQPIYCYLGDVASNGLMKCKMSYGGKYGYINTSNTKVIDYQFDEAEDFHDGAAAIKIGDSWGLIDANGKYNTSVTYKILKPIGNGRYAFGEKNTAASSSNAILYGMMDTSGNIIVQPKYEGTLNKSEGIDGNPDDTSGRFCVRNSNNKYGYIDANGNEVIECQYKKAENFQNGYASVTTETDKTFIIDINGNIKLTLEEGEYMIDYSNGLFLIEGHESTNTTHKYMNLDGKTICKWVGDKPEL